MDLIDDQGRIVGLVNVIDALVVLLVIAVAVAGVSLVTAGPQSTAPTQVVTFRTNPQPEFVVEAIPTGPVPTDEIVLVSDKTVSELSDERYVATVDVQLRVTLRDDLPRFDGERLYIGRSMRLDFGTTIVEGTVIDLRPVETPD